MKRISFHLPGASGETVWGDFYLPGGEPRGAGWPILVFCHGFKGFKHWGAWPYLCERMTKSGFSVATITFSHAGVEKDSDVFDRLDLFQRNTIASQLQDLEIVMDAVVNRNIQGLEGCDVERLGLIGHSFGGGMVLLCAAKDTRVKAVALLAAISSFTHFSEEAKRQAEETGYFSVFNERTKQMLPVGKEYFSDLDKNKKNYSLAEKVRALNRPLLILHGTEDETVPAQAAQVLYDAADPKRTKLVWIEGGSHIFGVAHPFRGTTPQLELVMSELEKFFRKSL